MSTQKSGRKPRHSREQILDAALDVLDVTGIAGFNLRALADRLDLTPMAIYRLFEDKDSLLAAMAAHAFPGATNDVVTNEPWQQQLRCVLRLLFDGFARHPGALELILGRVEATGQFDRLRLRLISPLSEAGFDPDTTALAIAFLISSLFGTVALEGFRRRHRNGTPLNGDSQEQTQVLPHLRAPAWDARRSFEFALDRNIAALELMLTDTTALTPHDSLCAQMRRSST